MGATETGVLTLAREAGIELEHGVALPWLTNRGHLNPVLADAVPETTLAILSSIHQWLGGDERLLAGNEPARTRGLTSTLASWNLIVEVDEI